jgi:ferredoxin like protein
MSEQKPPVNIDEKLGLITYKNDHQTHIQIKDADTNTSPCVIECKAKPCTTVCPARVYVWEDALHKIVVNYENCIECGACRMLCPFDNVNCHWPRGGFGVQYKLG